MGRTSMTAARRGTPRNRGALKARLMANEKGACLRQTPVICGSDTWIRTRDPLINSQLLYR